MGIESAVGIPWPLTTGSSGKLGFATGEDVLVFSLRSLLGISLNEVPMVPTLGADIDGIIFENMTPLQQARIQRSIQAAISQFEPRAQVLAIRLQTGKQAGLDAESSTFVDVEYRAGGSSGNVEIPIGTVPSAE